MRYCPSCKSIYATRAVVCAIHGVRLEDGAADPLTGHVVGGFRLGALLGSGSLGRVYLGERGAARAAVKVLFGELASDPEVRGLISVGARLAKRIGHPALVPFSEVESTPEGLGYLVSEVVEGASLDRELAARGPMRPTRAAELVRELASALAAGHAFGLAHGDLAPANVMVDGTRARLLDFGLLGFLPAHGERLARVGLTFGAPAYRAPEASPYALASPSTDLYALGVLLYEMLSARLPQRAAKVRALPTPPAVRSIEQLASWLLEESPDLRPQSADDVARTLTTILGDLSRKSGPPPVDSGAG